MGGNPDVTNASRSCDDGKRFNIFKSNNLEHREVVETLQVYNLCRAHGVLGPEEIRFCSWRA